MGPQLKQPRVAELVAAAIREKILDGTYAGGDVLPKQEELLAEFQVSMPSLREGLLILEREGLLQVRRGNVGGAVVQVPDAGDAGYSLALVLQSRAVPLDDVVAALRRFEPACAAACAARPDRAVAVVPALEANLEAAEAALNEPEEFLRLARRFHEELVERCGNETMRLVVGTLEELWSAQATEHAERTSELGDFAAREVRRGSLGEHRALVERIAAGDVGGAESLAHDHLGRPERSSAVGRGLTVNADALRRRGR